VGGGGEEGPRRWGNKGKNEGPRRRQDRGWEEDTKGLRGEYLLTKGGKAQAMVVSEFEACPAVLIEIVEGDLDLVGSIRAQALSLHRRDHAEPIVAQEPFLCGSPAWYPVPQAVPHVRRQKSETSQQQGRNSDVRVCQWS
jgi:hypothetical protein